MFTANNEEENDSMVMPKDTCPTAASSAVTKIDSRQVGRGDNAAHQQWKQHRKHDFLFYTLKYQQKYLHYND